VACTYDISSNGDNYEQALAAYTTCASADQPDGYCAGHNSSAAFLRNQDVCKVGSSTDIGFHIRIPFTVYKAETYHFRLHADYGLGRYCGGLFLMLCALYPAVDVTQSCEGSLSRDNCLF
jgi:hypothetical protein